MGGRRIEEILQLNYTPFTMKGFYFYLICPLLLVFTVSAFAQQGVLETDTAANGTVTFERFSTTVNPKPVSEAGELLRVVLQMRPADSLRLDTIIRQEKLGLSHLVYQQYYKGVKVLNGTYSVHAKNGIIETIDGHFVKVGDPGITPRIDEQIGLSKALNEINARLYGWQDPATENMYKETAKDSSATLYPKGELVIYYDDRFTRAYRLAYSFHIYAVSPLTDDNVFVDAVSGKVIGTENLIRDGNGVGAANVLHIPQTSTAGHLIPNPARDEINILLDDTDSNQIPGCFGVIESKTIREVNIYNASGQRVKTQKFSGNTGRVQMDISVLRPGLYFVVISDGKHTETQKLVISR